MVDEELEGAGKTMFAPIDVIMSAMEASQDELGPYLHPFGLVFEEAQQTRRWTLASANFSSCCSLLAGSPTLVIVARRAF